MTGMDILDLIGKYAGTAITTFVAGGAGAYFGSYFRKKAENKAMHQDIGKLVDQVRAVTKATREIEAKISDDVWARQRRWELRRDIMLQATDELTNIQGAMAALTAGAMARARATDDTRKSAALDKMNAASEALGSALPGLFKSVYRVQLVCGPDVKNAYLKVQELMFEVHHQIANNNIAGALDMTHAVGKATELTQAAIQHELGMDGPNPIVPQSSGSSGHSSS